MRKREHAKQKEEPTRPLSKDLDVWSEDIANDRSFGAPLLLQREGTHYADGLRSCSDLKRNLMGQNL